MLKCLPTRQRRLLPRPRPRPRPSVSRPRPRPRRTVSRPRRDRGVRNFNRGETEPRHYCASRRPRDRGVKTEATSLDLDRNPNPVTMDPDRYPNRHQNLTDCSLCHATHFQQNSSKSVHNFLSNQTDRQTDGQTDKQRTVKHSLFPSEEVMKCLKSYSKC